MQHKGDVSPESYTACLLIILCGCFPGGVPSKLCSVILFHAFSSS